jgi:hypothetical protein
VEKLYAQLLLELANLAGKRRLSYVEPLRCPTKIQFFCYSQEVV